MWSFGMDEDKFDKLSSVKGTKPFRPFASLGGTVVQARAKNVLSAVISPMFPPEECVEALDHIKRIAPCTLLECVGSVLLGYQTKSSSGVLTTFLRDLSADDYTDFYPRDLVNGGKSLGEVWSLFTKLAMEWLYPLAKLDVVHRDLRYMVKYNDMALVDLDSLVSFEPSDKLPAPQDDRFLFFGKFNARLSTCAFNALAWRAKLERRDRRERLCTVQARRQVQTP